MKLSDILQGLQHVTILSGDAEIDITGIQIDSRQIADGQMFVAVCGTQTDGHQYIDKAILQGARAIVCQAAPTQLADGVTYVQLDNTEHSVGQMVTNFYGRPSEKLKLVGVTGTNGKTTIATLLYKLFGQLGYTCGLCSTVCNYIGDKALDTSHTTPDPITLNKLLAQMVEAGCQYAFMECSSHAIDQQRIGGLKFVGGVFTNLTRDHMDYHKTVENYLHAKKAFFDGLPKDAFAVTNLDDRNGLVMTQNTAATVKTYSQQRPSDFHAKILEMTFEGMLLNVNGTEVSVPLVGKFNVSNLLAIYGAACMLGVEPMAALTILSGLTSVSGRFETLRSPKGFTAIVDYAHTPDALVNVLNAIHEVLRGQGQIITVCGAGGNRDKGKRPLMASESARLSDRVVITSDNPRFEEPQDIINDMLEGITDEQRPKVLAITDRREAIRTACLLAQPGDVILVAGKGHENYQDVKGVKYHFDDKEVLLEAFKLN